jgi:uroporphyrinogen III methyltransferase/synthase
MTNKQGKVYLIGAGPGDISYLTLKAKEILSQTEILIYDALVEPQLLALVPAECLKIDVGKRGERKNTPQSKINQLLTSYCLQGKQVARLKSGDPLVFGRLSPEIEALKAAKCDFELIPGISSALAAPLLAGIPLTDKIDSSCFAVLTGHNPELLDWQALARIDTLVILMGGKTLPLIVQKLQENGRSPSWPMAIIRNCGRENQRIWLGTLADIVEKTVNISLSPAIIIVGKVIEKRTIPMTTHIDSLPLAGKTVLVTRAPFQSSKFRQMLEEKGAVVREMPTLVILPPSSWAKLDVAIASLSEFNWLILTSANGVESFFKRLHDLGQDSRALAGVKIAVVGQKTAQVLQEYGLTPDFIPPNFVADSLVANFPQPLGEQKILFPRVETGGRELLVQELTKQGAKVVEVAAYQSGCPAEIDGTAWQALREGMIDIITFASSKTVKNFHQLITSALQDNPEITPQSLLEKVGLASIGPETSKTCLELLGRVDVEAQEYTLEGLIQAIINFQLS